jgi:hypothetical protein
MHRLAGSQNKIYNMPGLRVAKASEQDIEITRSFLQACEFFWDARPIYSLRDLESDWETWDDDDEHKQELLQIKQELCDYEGLSESEIDNRLIVYEFLKRRYKIADNKWGRVLTAAEVLIDNCCDPTERHLAFYPAFEMFHVAPEQ